MILNPPEQKFLRCLPQLSVLEDQEIIDLASRLNKKKYREGEYIFFQGDQVRSLYFLEMGKIEIYKSDINGRKLTLWSIVEDEIFCLANLYALEAFANARVVQDSMVYSVPKDHVDTLIEHSGIFSRNLIRCLSGRLAAYSNLLDDIAFKKVEARLARILLSRISSDKSSPFTCDLTHQEIASMAGTSREVIGRCIKLLCERKVIRKQSQGRKRCIFINSYSKLKEIADSYS